MVEAVTGIPVEPRDISAELERLHLENAMLRDALAGVVHEIHPLDMMVSTLGGRALEFARDVLNKVKP